MGKIGDEEMNQATNTNNQLLKCLPRCERQSETLTFTFSSFPTEDLFAEHQNFCLAFFKVTRICENPEKAKIFESASDQTGITCNDIRNENQTFKLCKENGKLKPEMIPINANITSFVYKYAKNNFAFLQVFIKDPHFTLIKCDLQISLISFLGNAGGLLGLSLGLSMVSIFEMAYHFINFLSDKVLKK
jgi:hypothetical protein